MNEHKQAFKISKSDFKLSSTADVEHKTRYIKPPKSKEIPERMLKYEYAETLAKDIDIEKGSRYFVVINGTFIAGDFIEALIVEKKYQVRTLTISTLSMSENNVDSLANLINGGYVEEMNLIISDYFYSHERGNLVKYIYQELDKENRFQLAAAGTHCKICLIETVCGLKIVIHGSANLRSSSNIEQLMIEENADLYNFNMEYQSEIIEKYKTIKKPLRYTQLWDIIK